MSLYWYSLTPKQREIMFLIYRFRFLNRVQIQTLMKHKDPKRINVWLKDLVAQGFLGRIYSTTFLEKSKPAIYYANPGGARYFKEVEECRTDLLPKLFREKTRSQRFIQHCLSVANVYVNLLTPSDGTVVDEFKTKVDLAVYDDFMTPLQIGRASCRERVFVVV